jgi:predicted ATPase/class 3 adenylate cyclase
MRLELPSGTVTFLFTDVEGSTKLLDELGAERYSEALAEHRRLIREACSAEGGVEVDTQGDAFFFVFPSAPGALGAAAAFTGELASGPIQVRVGLHTGTPLLVEEGYVGHDVHFAARVAATSHGGQVVLSAATRELCDDQLQGWTLTDLGEHRLKDVADAVSIYQLGEGSFPPLKTISNTNLPRPASSFVGREGELADVLARVEGGARLLTLTGPGGSGKTRLALEAASTLVPEYKAGVFWVGLAALRDPALVTETIAQTLGAKDGLDEHIGERELMLLLDNLEQVIDAAPELASLLETCPNLTLLVTSRELLRVRGELEYPVPPLASPEAVALFCERSRLEPSQEIPELCSRLDNLPLAVELAAARTKALSPAQILDRLSQRLDLLTGGRDADPRQQTLRTTIEWSYDLLSDEEQLLFARLSVFAGGCTLDAAEEVASAELDTLQSLVEKSLLRFTEGRYWMLETIREFAAERFEDVDTEKRYVDHFSGLVSLLGSDIGSMTGTATVMELLDVETANVREVLRRLLDRRHGEQALEIAVALAPYWFARGHYHEGLMWVEETLSLDRPTDVALRGRALSVAADLSWGAGELVRARAYATENLELAEGVGEPRAIGQALHDLAEVVTEEGDFEQAKELYEQAIHRVREVNYPAPGSIGNLALILFAEGDYERARELTRQATGIFRERENQLGYVIGLRNLACAALYCGDVDDARSTLRESIDICAVLRYEAVLESCFRACAAILARTDQPREAAVLLGASEKLLEEMRSPLEATERGMHDETQALIRATLGEREIAVAWKAGKELALEEAVSLALASLD